MTGRNEYGYNGYSGKGYSQHVNQPATNSTQQSLGYQYPQPTTNYPGATSGDYFSGRSAVVATSGRVAQATSDSYSNRNNYDSNAHLAYGTTGNTRQYVSPTLMAPRPTQAQTQQPYTDSNAAARLAYNYQTNRADNSASVSSGRSTATSLHPGYAAPPAQTSRSTLIQTQERTHASQAPQHASHQYYQQPSHVQQTVYEGDAVAVSNPRYSTGARQIPKESRPTVDTTNHRHLPAPQTTSQRRPPEPTTTAQTVDPTQVYDPYHDWQREHQRAEAEAKKRAEAEAKQRIEMEAKQQAELAAKERSEAETKQRAEAEAQQTPAVIAEAPAAQPKKKAARKSDGTAPKRVRKKKDDKQPEKQDEAQAAALTLLQAANGSASSGSQSEILQEQMREMFKKMREFNALDPDMLGRLWQEERDNHIGGQATTTITTKEPEMTAPQSKSKSRPTPSTTKASVGTATSTVQQRPSASHTGAKPATQNSPLPLTATPVPKQALTATPTSSTPSVAQPIWPADKKATLAIKAAELLNAANPGKTILSEEIAALLAKNPSYIELCEQIQGRGLTVDRAKLAKALLNAVPDINRHRTEKPAKSTSLDSAPVASMQASSNSLARLMNGESLVETTAEHDKKTAPATTDSTKKRRTPKQKKAKQNESVQESNLDPQLEGLDVVKHFVAGQWQPAGSGETSTQKAQKAKARPSVATPVPTKEGQARKRTFADLVDLSRVDSDEDIDDSPFTKRLETEPLPAIETEGPPVEEPTQLPTPPPTDSAPIVPIMRGPRPAGFELAQVNVSSSIVPPNLVPPQTVPRQRIVPQQQTAPTLSPQPAPTRPAVYAPAPAPAPAPPLPHQTTTMAKPLDRYKAIRRSSYDPRTIARDVLLASGRHPDMRHLNAHLEILKRTMGVDVNADLGTFRWDLADPGGPAPGSGAELPAPLSIEVHNDADDEDDSDNDSLVGGSRRAVRQAVGVDGATTFEAIGQASRSHKKKTLPSQDGHGIRRRGPGRPATGSAPVQAGTPTGESPRGYAALRAQQSQLDENGQPIKKRGRPVGWRMHMMKNGPPAGSGIPSKATKSQPKPPSPGPEYQVFLCDWEGCRAELHNLSTLRKHIHKVHGKPSADGDYKCVWTGCATPSTSMDSGRSVTRWTHFSSKAIDQWKQHVEKKHLEPIAWKQGDGPAGGVSSASETELSEAYLSDSHGRRLTPRVVVPAPPTAPAGPARSNAHEAALEVEREATKRKRAIGIGIDKGGARLVNDKRRQGFIDDDDTAMVVDDDE